MNATQQRDDASTMTPRQWEQLSRMLDELVARLRRDDQRAVLLRFYEQKSYPEMAAALGVSEDAARKRTDRAVEKLRQLAGHRELTMSAETMSAETMSAETMSAETLSAALLAQVTSPAAAATVTAGAIEMGSGGSTSAASIAAIAKGAIQMMNLMKMRVPLAACAAIVLLAVVGVTVWNGGAKTVAATQAATRPAAPAVATTAPATTAPAAVLEDSPKSVVFAAFRAAAAGDADGLLSRFDRVTPEQAQTLRQTTEVMSAARRLSDAVKQQFGVDVEQTLGRSVGMGVAEFDVTSAMETIHGDSATVEMKAGPGDIRLVRAGRTWKISADVLETLNAGGVRQLHANIPALDTLTDEIRAGKYKTIGDLRQAVGGIMRPPRGGPATSRPQAKSHAGARAATRAAPRGR